MSIRVSAVGASVAKDFTIDRSYRLPFVMDLFFGFVNLFVYFFISKTFGSAPEHSLAGAPSYFAFAAVGSSLFVVMQTAVRSVSGGVREGQVTGTLEALVVQPLGAAEMSLGFAAYPVAFALVRVVAYLALAGAVLGLGLQNPDWSGFIVMLLATGLALVGLGVFMGALVLVLKKSGAFDNVVMFAMGFVGGGFFPTSVLPRWLQPLADLVPTRYAFDGVRSALFKGYGWSTDAIVLIAFGCVALPLSIQVFRWALTRAEAAGTLGQY
jgi:ABC-2 type transport system permease protein